MELYGKIVFVSEKEMKTSRVTGSQHTKQLIYLRTESPNSRSLYLSLFDADVSSWLNEQVRVQVNIQESQYINYLYDDIRILSIERLGVNAKIE